MSLIEIKDVDFAYDRELVLKNINLSVESGEFLGIIGPNASGKSTLVKLILGLLEPDTGTIRVLDMPVTSARKQIGYVPQYPTFSRRDFPINVRDTVMLGRLGLSHWFSAYSSTDRQICQEVLRAVEIEDIASRPIGTLSGGQLQRVLIARALVSEPEILILDEPTANIDIRVEEDIFGLLKQYNERMTILVVSHDIGFISSYVDRVACVNKTLACHNTEEISGKTIEELYGIDVRMIDHAH
ncbi:MAG: ABC transporter ATP-binding protein [Gammaproteobacteria bacterium]|nr:ATP-binding cassette domain-containing protein [Gammaproteobacteria bacterium]NIO61704.1 ATP-binding cassette domain-containing protein [Gammaproteobacteria bacterium]NIP49324.1 ABC transporter ATP-binding protein [Gammaproteobacteria bacterium]NIQ10546.1 ABC transporter ATP-binding protein [Gammaproteobacteria bacterium]NIQ18955.1 ATP-binding cassette domain-containing protein [Gammaproteobacteria bacterium]